MGKYTKSQRVSGPAKPMPTMGGVGKDGGQLSRATKLPGRSGKVDTPVPTKG